MARLNDANVAIAREIAEAIVAAEAQISAADAEARVLAVRLGRQRDALRRHRFSTG